MQKEVELSHGVQVNHYFGGGIYAKETAIPAGCLLTQHVHDHDHLSILGCGTVEVCVDGQATRVTAPACLHIKAGSEHQVTSITDAVWYCIWPEGV